MSTLLSARHFSVEVGTANAQTIYFQCAADEIRTGRGGPGDEGKTKDVCKVQVSVLVSKPIKPTQSRAPRSCPSGRKSMQKQRSPVAIDIKSPPDAPAFTCFEGVMSPQNSEQVFTETAGEDTAELREALKTGKLVDSGAKEGARVYTISVRELPRQSFSVYCKCSYPKDALILSPKGICKVVINVADTRLPVSPGDGLPAPPTASSTSDPRSLTTNFELGVANCLNFTLFMATCNLGGTF